MRNDKGQFDWCRAVGAALFSGEIHAIWFLLEVVDQCVVNTGTFHHIALSDTAKVDWRFIESVYKYLGVTKIRYISDMLTKYSCLWRNRCIRSDTCAIYNSKTCNNDNRL